MTCLYPVLLARAWYKSICGRMASGKDEDTKRHLQALFGLSVGLRYE